MAEYRNKRKQEERIKAVENGRRAQMDERSKRVQMERKRKQPIRPMACASGIAGIDSGSVGFYVLLG